MKNIKINFDNGSTINCKLIAQSLYVAIVKYDGKTFMINKCHIKRDKGEDIISPL